MLESSIGSRIAAHRRRRGLSQVVVAGLVGRSESWLSQVEQGLWDVESYPVLCDLARVLRVDLDVLTGVPAAVKAGSDGGTSKQVASIERALLFGAELPRTRPPATVSGDVADEVGQLGLLVL